MNIEQVAQRLLEAERTKKTIAPLTETMPHITVDDAYRIQIAQIAAKKAQGATVKGLKIGLTSKVMQDMLGVYTPDYGFILDTMVFDSTIDVTPFIQPKVEFELAFFFKQALTGTVTVEDVIAAVDYVVPAIEIIDSRIADWRIQFEDTVADNGSSAGAVLGTTKTKLVDVEDITAIPMTASKNGKAFDTATSAAVLGNPLEAVVWLANAIREYGVMIEPGMFVLSGAVSKAVTFEAGDVFEADFGALGKVSATFAKEVGIR
ncbi:2-keto-4-pentenoate hydratase [Caryophanon tenue]|uniref:2-keto-4-pentenoate hydratase n=1 Tax=Caryophanon tenue TaxID=33978 RepID=A0A1C0YBZ1_9BACL|nr:fumarylacetoacetate hydrolase family protein [Caryophanon tenue]OCS84664.1 2-keto-4-pentenoate hydratase [Caryophanon tenue]